MFYTGNSSVAADTCCICHSTKTDTVGSGYEVLVTCVTETAAKRLKTCNVERQDNELLSADVAGKDWKAIVAYELRYHRSCYRTYTREGRRIAPGDETIDKVLKIVDNFVLKQKETMTPKTLQDIYNENSSG